MSPIQKLDIVLNYLATDLLAKPHIDHLEIFQNLKKKHPELNDTNDFGSQLYKILDKLIDDKFVKSASNNNRHRTITGNDTLNYSITFLGEYQNSVGGYHQIQESEESERLRLEEIDKRAKVDRDRVFYLTLVISFGTAIAAVYYLVELYWKYHWFH